MHPTNTEATISVADCRHPVPAFARRSCIMYDLRVQRLLLIDDWFYGDAGRLK